jgi:hypothetical protein
MAISLKIKTITTGAIKIAAEDLAAEDPDRFSYNL